MAADVELAREILIFLEALLSDTAEDLERFRLQPAELPRDQSAINPLPPVDSDRIQEKALEDPSPAAPQKDDLPTSSRVKETRMEAPPVADTLPPPMPASTQLYAALAVIVLLVGVIIWLVARA